MRVPNSVENISKQSGSKKMEAELVILGGGGAGLAAATAATEEGVKSIVVLEKRTTLGGNTARATGLFACESPVQARERIIADKDELLKRAVKWAHLSRIDPRIIRAFLNKSGDTIRWLEHYGLEFHIVPFYPNQQPRVWHCPKGRGLKLTQVLAETCRKRGVKLLLRSSGKKIRLDAEGRVTGVVAVKEGEEFEIIAGSTIIATGGLGGNKELLNKYCPSYYDDMPLRGLPLTGDGLLMAAEAGAAIHDFVTLLKEGPRVNLHSWPLMGLERAPATLWVNSRGRRFVDEMEGDSPFESVNAMLRQPDKICYTLLDSAIRKHYEDTKPGLEKALQKEARKAKVKIADSWDEIAGWIGADPKTLEDTIEEYNVFCHQGYDAVFAKDRRYLMPLRTAPYFAIKCMPVYLDTIGGIKINEHMEVMDDCHHPIPGLYAAGVITSGWMAETYCGDLSGSAFGFAINSGRIAGENAAKFTLGK